MKKLLKIIFKVIVSIAMILIGYFTVQHFRERELDHLLLVHNRTATLYLPGLGGNALSTGHMINVLDRHQIGKKVLIIHVKQDGSLQVEKTGEFGNNNPLIQVLFADNQYPKTEGNQLISVMRLLYDKYQIRNVNFVGHSSGGDIAFYYMIHAHNLNNLPRPNKVVTIGGDFNATKEQLKLLPNDLNVLNIAGEIGNIGSDGLESVKEVKSQGSHLKPYVGHYKYLLYRRWNPLLSFHSMLHENPDIDKIMAQFLFGKS